MEDEQEDYTWFTRLEDLVDAEREEYDATQELLDAHRENAKRRDNFET